MRPRRVLFFFSLGPLAGAAGRGRKFRPVSQVLYALGFDVSVSNPILPFSELLARLVACGSLPDARQRQFAQVGINFVGDSRVPAASPRRTRASPPLFLLDSTPASARRYRTTLCLSAEPAKLASAAAFLTFVFLRLVPPPDDKVR